MLKLKSVLLIICLTLLVPSGIFAQVEDVQMLINELKVFAVDYISRVAVGDPDIADVTVLSKQELLLVAKKAGTTSLIIWDESGQHPYFITVLDQDLGRTADKIRGVFSASDIQGVWVKPEGDNIYVIGEVLSEYELQKIQNALAPFSNIVNLVSLKERQPLVEVDVNVLEVAYDDLKKLGMDWSNSLPITYSEPSGSKIDGKVPKLWKVFRWDRTAVTAKLNFLIGEDKARTLANPKLITLSGKEASFLVGGEVPYVTYASAETEQGRTNVEWKEYGINLKIHPLVNLKNEIKTKIKAEVSELDWTNAVTQEGFNIPALKKREVQTELFLNEEDTIFLAGLIKTDDSRNVDRLPWLSKVPILGELFKSREFRDQRTELVISITPRVIGDGAGAEDIVRKAPEQDAALAAQRSFSAYSEESSPLAYYANMVEDIITRHVIYPVEAQESQQEGAVEIDLWILSNGKLEEAIIKQSSGFRALDEAALAAVREQAPYPSFPSQITQQELHLTVPVIFKSYEENE